MSRIRWGLFATAALTIAALGAMPLAQAQSPQARPNTVHLEKSPLSGGVLMARAIRAGLIHLPGGTNGAVKPPSLNCKPAPCALPNVQASGGSQPVDEDPLSIDPNNGKHILTAGNDYNCSQSLQGYYASTDGGKTFIHTCGTLAAGATGGFGDPAVGWDLNGNAYRAGIDGTSDGLSEIVVGKSTDFGTTWTSPVVAAKVSGIFMDKEWLEVDTNQSSSFKNNLYLSITQFYSNNDSQIGVSRSSDGGATWKLVNVSTRQVWPNSVDQFSDIAVGADGAVYVSWLRCPVTGPTGDCGGTAAAMYFSKSTDGGKTWSAEGKISDVNLAPDSCGAFYGCLPNTFERVSDIPVIAIDTAATSRHFGTLYMIDYTWTGTYMKVQATSSADGGATWSKPIGVTPDTDTHDQFFPWINVSSSGLVGASWLDRSLDPNNVKYDAFGAAGKTVKQLSSANLRLSTVSSDPNDDGFGSGFMGDYDTSVWDPAKKKLLFSWTDTRGGNVSQDEVGGLKP